MFQAFLQAIHAHDTVIIHRHSRPDGDALGAQIGLKHLILHNFPHKRVFAVGDEAGYLSFMEDSQMDCVADSDYTHALAVILDTSSPQLISDSRYTLAAATARVDHHLFLGRIAQIEVIDSTYESCCGLITQFALDCGLTLTATAARALYTGMVTDSGRFRYDSTTSRTFRLAAFLREHDFDPGDIYRALYAETPEGKLRKAQFFTKVRFTPRKVAYIYTTRQELQQLNMDTYTASRGMVNTMADLKGVDIWATFTESDEGILCELRSARLSVVHIAIKYGGGGHAKACGACLPSWAAAEAMLQELDQLTGEST